LCRTGLQLAPHPDPDQRRAVLLSDLGADIALGNHGFADTKQALHPLTIKAGQGGHLLDSGLELDPCQQFSGQHDINLIHDRRL